MSVLGLSDAKAHLNITVSTYDTEIQSFIDAAEASLAQQVGPLSTSSVTKRVPGFGWNLHLPIYPAVSLTSVTPIGGTALTLSTLFLESDSGAVSRNDLGFFTSAAYDVVYTAGRSVVPADLLMAVKKLVKFLWNDQRGGGVRPGQAQESVAPGRLFPLDVQELIEPYKLQTLGA